MSETDDSPSGAFRPGTAAEASAWLRARFDDGGPGVALVGGETSPLVPEAGDVPTSRLVTTRLNRVVDYPARDMTITIEAGLRAAELQTILAGEGQRLAVDIPQADRAAIGGAIAENVSGPLRFAHGTLRDYVIGIRGVDGRGRTFAAGGRVVKNVAGYDLCKLLVGSRGTLALITEVTFKLRPQPETRRVICARCGEWSQVEIILAALLTSATRPVAIELLCPRAAGEVASTTGVPLPAGGPLIAVSVEGTEPETDWQLDTLQRELRPHAATIEPLTGADGESLLRTLAERPAVATEPILVRASLPPSRLVAWARAATGQDWTLHAHAGDGIAVVGASTATDDVAARIASLGRLVPDIAPRLQVLSPAASPFLPAQHDQHAGSAVRLAQRIKHALDPLGLLNPHRTVR